MHFYFVAFTFYFLFCFSFRYIVYVDRKKQVKPEHKRQQTKNMGNQGSSRGGHGGPSGHGLPAADEPLEAYLREKQRNDHLKNLGLKRHTSLRKSISKKLKRHKKQPSSTATNTNPPINEQNHTTTNNTTSTTMTSGSIEVVDNGGTNNSKSKQKSHCDVHEEQPFRRPSNSGQDGSQSNIPSKVKQSGSLELC